MNDNFGLDCIGQIHISVEDIPRAVEFYRDVLGMKFLFAVPGQPMAFFDCGGVRLYLGKPSSPQYRSSPLIYYRVTSIESAFEVLRLRGVKFDSNPHVVHKTPTSELWMAGFRDPDDNNILIMSDLSTA
jgi:catechol 2,3-dioxygenase-like lactoylglutathione lyase family enzyme